MVMTKKYSLDEANRKLLLKLVDDAIKYSLEDDTRKLLLRLVDDEINSRVTNCVNQVRHDILAAEFNCLISLRWQLVDKTNYSEVLSALKEHLNYLIILQADDDLRNTDFSDIKITINDIQYDLPFTALLVNNLLYYIKEDC